MDEPTGLATDPGGRATEVPDLIDLLSATPPPARLAFARWCRDAVMPEAARQPPLGSPEETAAIAALEAGIEDRGGRLTPEIHAFFDPIYGEWTAWRAAQNAIAAVARAMVSDTRRIGDLAAVLAQLEAVGGLTNRP